MFAWTLQSENIKFTKEAIKEIYKSIKYLAFTYDESIPLMVRSFQRIKLAKLAVATAAMVFNYDGENLIVDKQHVKFSYDYLCQIFNKPIMAYDEYSRLEKSRHQILDKDEIRDLIRDKQYVMDQLIDVERITQTDLQEMFDLNTRADTRKVLNILLVNKALKRISSGYEKTPAFIDFLREHKNGDLFEDKDEIEKEINGEGYEETKDLPF